MAAAVWLCVGAVLLWLCSGEVSLFFYQPRAIAVLHCLTLGWISSLLLGAVWLETARLAPDLVLRRGRIRLQIFLFHFGASGLVAHFWIGRLNGMAWSAATLLLSVVLLAAHAGAGAARDIFVFNTRVGLGVGTTLETAYKLPNGAGGIFVGPGTSNVTIGGVPDLTKPLVRYANEIVGNRGNGLTAISSRSLVLLGNTIRDNLAAGVVLHGGGCAVHRRLHYVGIGRSRPSLVSELADFLAKQQCPVPVGTPLPGFRVRRASGVSPAG